MASPVPTQPEAVQRARAWLERERAQDSLRDQELEKLAAAYDGYIWDLAGSDLYGNSAMTRLTADLKDEALKGGDPDSFRYSEVSINLIRPLTDDWVSLMGVMPSLSVPARKKGDPSSQAQADLRERILRSIWADSNMVIQSMEDAHYRTLFGSTAAIVLPDPGEKRVRIRLTSPYHCHARYKLNGTSLHHLAWDYEEDTELLAESYPDLKRYLKGERVAGRIKFPENLKVTEWNDENTRLFMVQDTWFPGLPLVEHGWGLVPGSVIPNLVGTGSIWSRSDSQQVVHISQLISELMSMNYDAVFQKVYDEPVVFGEKPITQFAAGPFEITQVHDKDGRMELMHGNLQLPDVQASLTNLERFARLMGGWPSVLSSELDSSYISGKAFSAAQGPVAARAAIKQIISAVHYQRLNSFALMLYDILFPHQEITMWNLDGALASSVFPNAAKGAASEVTFKPSRDIAGQYENIIQYLPAGTDRYRQTIENLQLLEARILSRQYLQDMIPGVDVGALEEQIKRAFLEDAELQAQAQSIVTKAQVQQQLEGMAQAGVMQQGAEQPAPTGGEEAPAVPPERVTLSRNMGSGALRREALGPGAQGPGPAPRPRSRVTLAEARSVFRQVRRIRGEVYLGGAIVTTGYTDGPIEVWLTDPNDGAAIISQTPYGAQKRLMIHRLPKGEVPDEAVVNVTPPAEEAGETEEVTA